MNFLNFEKIVFQIRNFGNFLNWKINKFPELYNLKNQKILRIFSVCKTIKFQKLANLGIVRPLDISQHSQFFQFAYFPCDINEFRRVIFSIFIFY